MKREKKKEIDSFKKVREGIYQSIKLRGRFSEFMNNYEPLPKITHYGLINPTHFSFYNTNTESMVMNPSSSSLNDLELAERICMARYILSMASSRNSRFRLFVPPPKLNEILSWYINDLVWSFNKDHASENIKSQIEYGCKYGRTFAVIGIMIVFGLSIYFLPLLIGMLLFIIYTISFSLA